MCRLLGVIANKPVDLKFSLLEAYQPFRNFGDYEKNPDGWGIGWYKKRDAKVFKEGIPAVSSVELPKLAKEATSNIMIVHVRKKTGAERTKRNSHPFKHQNWIFAHNGSVKRDYLFQFLSEEYKDKIKGETDSEVYFYWILQSIKEHKEIIGGIKKAISKTVNENYSGLNFLLSNGKRFYAFRYARKSPNYYSLYVLRRDPSDIGPMEFVSQETKALLSSKSLKGEKAILICSEMLTLEENWEDIPLGSLLEISPYLDIKEWKIL